MWRLKPDQRRRLHVLRLQRDYYPVRHPVTVDRRRFRYKVVGRRSNSLWLGWLAHTTHGWSHSLRTCRSNNSLSSSEEARNSKRERKAPSQNIPTRGNVKTGTATGSSGAEYTPNDEWTTPAQSITPISSYTLQRRIYPLPQENVSQPHRTSGPESYTIPDNVYDETVYHRKWINTLYNRKWINTLYNRKWKNREHLESGIHGWACRVSGIFWKSEKVKSFKNEIEYTITLNLILYIIYTMKYRIQEYFVSSESGIHFRMI